VPLAARPVCLPVHQQQTQTALVNPVPEHPGPAP
jgi:hypothetical protein